jgi:methionine sulfoxide reductase heme-binding subunit
MKPWHLRYARALIAVGATVAAVAIASSAWWSNAGIGHALVDARQLFGLWALGFLLASILLGPLTSVLPWIPFKSSLMFGRRAVGISALVFAGFHVAAYVWSVGRRHWSELYMPGSLWIIGLILGLIALADLVALGVTSRDTSVKRMGGKNWKRLHRTIYFALVVVLLHAFLVGADFGFNHGPDVTGDADYGSLIGFASITAVWLILIYGRRRGWRWTPKFLMEARD